MIKTLIRKKAFYLALVGIVLSILLVIRSNPKSVESTPLAQPNRNPFKQAVAASGIVESVGENTRLAPAVSGLVKSMGVKPGDKVTADSVLLRLDDRALRGAYEVQQAQVAKLDARYAKLKRLSNPEALSADERDTLRYDWQSAHAELKRIELLLDQLQLKAPRDGVILQVNTRVGEYVTTPISENYVPPIVLGASHGLQIRADVDEVNAPLIKSDAKAVAYLRGVGEKKAIPLSFVRIEPYVIPKKSLTGDNTERVDTRVLQVIFRTDETADLYVGQQLDVYIEY